MEENLSTEGHADRPQKIRIEQHSIAGIVWIGAWLFTIGFLHLGFWQAVLAIVLWPYYLGVHFGAVPR